MDLKTQHYYEKVGEEYIPVPYGKNLKEGNIYYTSSAGAGAFTATGNEVVRSYYVREYKAVTSGTTLTAGKIYYASSTGDGEFTATGSEEVAGKYEEANIWEIVYDDNQSPNDECFRLRQFRSFDAPVSEAKYIGWNTSDDQYPLKGDASTAVRLSVSPLPMLTYT
jgi:hypothetical protein